MCHPANFRALRPHRIRGLGAALLCLSVTPARSSAQDVPEAPAVSPDVKLPSVEYRQEAQYPEALLTPEAIDRAPARVEVVLFVTLDVLGHVTQVDVDQSGGPEFDDAARTAAQAWRFSPALQDGIPMAARIRVPFVFVKPEAAASPVAQRSVAAEAVPAPKANSKAQKTVPPPEVATEKAVLEPIEVDVVGHSPPVSRGASDYNIDIGKLSGVPRMDSASLLRLAPGVLLTNEGGLGHPYQIFLRGFDAREGQDIEFTVDGMPVNEVGNPHGNGLADTHFIIPELVSNLRVIEGPFAPQQGNFAVAGSAAYDLGLETHGLTATAMLGSFDSKRLLLLYRPEGSSDHTFGGAELFSTAGFGQNRAAERATAMGGYEGAVGKASAYRILATSYAAHYGQAGLIRLDDVESGRKGFYDTYDSTQGGDSSRHSVSATLESDSTWVKTQQSVFIVLRDFRLRENLTGFQEDPQQTWQSLHGQRGDLIDQRSDQLTFGARGSARETWSIGGQKQEVEIGYFGRHDKVEAIQERNRSGSNIPYRTDLKLDSSLSNVALYIDSSLKPVSFATFRGGIRGDLYHYRVTNLCALTTQNSFGGDPSDTECFASDRQGYRSPEQSASTSASILQPRGTLIFGPFSAFTLSASHGYGSRSIDPQYINQDLKTPFANVIASEAGVAYAKDVSEVDLSAHSVFFQTKVDRDLFFNQTEGRNTLSPGTTRVGWSGSARATGNHFDVASSLTVVRASFDDTGLVIPYAPNFVARADGVLFGALPLALGGSSFSGSIGSGVSYIGRRPLPFNELSETSFLVDVGASVKWESLSLGVITTNLLDRKYRLGEYNYASDFHSRPFPTLLAARHYSAGEPRAIYGTVTVTVDTLGAPQ